MIYTVTIKRLPSMNDYLKFIKTSDEYNAISFSLYHFFNSDTLTKSDYVHMVNVLLDKLPIYQRNNNVIQYAETVVTYATFNYPYAPDIARAIHGLLTTVPDLSIQLLTDYTL